uniref:Suppressor APC domain containing 1 n=2 Tax=Astyanax mexicanus TaxID=7994 RepID=A0A8B9H1H6_ASTMX
MAGDGSYTVVIVPLQNSLYSLDALRFFHWLKHLRALEREKDSLWMGLQVVEQTRLWYQHHLENVSERHSRICSKDQDKEVGPKQCVINLFLIKHSISNTFIL